MCVIAVNPDRVDRAVEFVEDIGHLWSTSSLHLVVYA